MPTIPLPTPVRNLFALFPLHTYPASPAYSAAAPPAHPTLWIFPPKHPGTSLLSGDVECVKWQAYLALRGIKNVGVRWNVSPQGGVDGCLPTLHLPANTLLGPRQIPAWVDSTQSDGDALGEPEGYSTPEARDESRAWVALLEGDVHAALVVSQREPSLLDSLYKLSPKYNLAALIQPPPAPLSGVSTPLPSSGINIPTSSVSIRLREAIDAVSDRLGKDKWFLGSPGPTAVDALLFAYIYSALQSQDEVRLVVERRVNLVTWERRVRALVEETIQGGQRQ
ncbi:hypothetical protein BOTBODRAFT_120582 [Botryobasidium botryosum FD-172 SS1]|uniref:Metaxin glutathione S-transferase domain-containing protein n=1 Tax=Botryobasidium botryosum (strain FD-172 SS1) TaxID=930990 RepID=A0A067M5B7_BOTB1|nr:hypothetical protein BOTBODRAFT_120582 [Botryobasidium botryosum FD-172 SS1]